MPKLLKGVAGNEKEQVAFFKGCNKKIKKKKLKSEIFIDKKSL